MKSASRFLWTFLLALLIGSAAWAQLPGDVVINEVMYDDTAGTDVEWVEIHNTTTAPIDISGWYLTDNNTYPTGTEGGILVPASTTLTANGYLVLCRVALDGIEGEILCSHWDTDWTLGNGGDNLALYTSNSAGTLIDGIISGTSTDYYPDLAGTNLGESIEKCNEDAPWSGLAADWHASTNVYSATGRFRFCTPGVANTTCGPVVDTDPPLLSYIWANSATQIDVRFNENVELITSETEANYSVNNGVGIPSSALRDGTNFRIVHLTFGTAMAANAYELTVSSVQDSAGNPIVTDFRPFVISTVTLNTNNIVISEVMYDDMGGTDIEWVEIYNNTGSWKDISGLLLADGAEYPPLSEGVIQVPNGTFIGAAQYLVLAQEDLPDITGEIICTVLYGQFIFNNAGDNIALRHPVGGALIHGSTSFNFSDLTATAGNSIEVCSNTLGSDWDLVEWYESAAAFAGTIYTNCTPGAAPSPCNVDVTPPEIVSVSVISNSAVDVLFNEDLEETTAETVGNYNVTPGSVTPATATLDGTNLALVHLTFASPFADNTYTLAANGVEDLSNNACVAETGQFVITTQTVQLNDVVISEIMYDNVGTDVEWVEIYNTTASTIDISGWIIQDGDTYPYPGTTEGIWTFPAGTTIDAGEYLVVAENSAILTDIPAAIIAVQTWDVALSNNGEPLALYTAASGGDLIHGSLTVAYPDLSTGNAGNSIEVCLDDLGLAWNPLNWYESDTPFTGTMGIYVNCTPGSAPHSCDVDVTPPVLTGAALSSLTAVDAYFDEALDAVTAETVTNYSIDLGFGNPTTATLLANNQTVRLEYGVNFTPNTYTLTVNNVKDVALNTIAAGSTAIFVVSDLQNIVINEFMPNPNFAGNADSLGEWFEIYNGEAAAVDLAGWIISDNNGSDTIEGPASVAAGDYFVFCSKGDIGINGGVPVDYAYHYGTLGWGLGLNNTGELISIRNAAGDVVTSVNYTGLPFIAGVSCQLESVTLDPSVVDNWCAAGASWVGATNNDFGTPGAATVCAGPSVPTDATICEIRTQDVCGTSLLYNVHVLTTGVVTHVDACRLNVYVEDNGCAVLVYGVSATENMIGHTRPPLVGDSIQIEGTLTRYNGLSEFAEATLIPVEVTYLAAAIAPTDEYAITAAQIDKDIDDCTIEAYESRHVTLENVTFVDGDGINMFGIVDANYLVVSESLADTAIFRLDNCDAALVGTLIPSDPVNIHGVLGQFDNTSCYCGGYQIQTGRHTPFEATEIPCTEPVSLTNYRNSVGGYVQLQWSPGLGQLCTCYKIYYATAGDAEFPAEYSFLTCVCGATDYQDTDPLAPMRVYVVVASATCP